MIESRDCLPGPQPRVWPFEELSFLMDDGRLASSGAKYGELKPSPSDVGGLVDS